LTFTPAQILDDSNPVDWFPAEHPVPPPIVAHGGPNGPTPCASCHFANGEGFLGGADIAGLPAAYIIEQVHEFRDGRRASAQVDRPDTVEMIKTAKTVSEDDLAVAAAYFSALPRTKRVRVVETDTVPKTRPNHYGWLDLAPDGGIEPINGRIIEVSEDPKHLFLADSHVGIVDYVPKGAIASGRALVRSGGPGGMACTSCHGANLHGTGGTPPIAGRSAAYVARMLWDIKTGARGGAAVSLMQGPAGQLDATQIRDISAYLASLDP
jgi:cytochrome c553